MLSAIEVDATGTVTCSSVRPMRYNGAMGGPASPASRSRSPGPTGEIGKAVVGALERSREVGHVLGMARRPFDPARDGVDEVGVPPRRHARPCRGRRTGRRTPTSSCTSPSYHGRRDGEPRGQPRRLAQRVRGDSGRRRRAARLRLLGGRLRLPPPRTRSRSPRTSRPRQPAHYYSAQKAEVEECSTTCSTAPAPTPTCSAVHRRRARGAAADRQPALRADLRAAARPGPELLAACHPQARCCPTRACPSSSFTTTMSPRRCGPPRSAVAARRLQPRGSRAADGRTARRELGWYSIPVPELAIDAAAQIIARLGFLPAQAQWIAAFREPVIMSASKARRELGWRPRHDALQTLRETIDATRLEPLIR